MAAQSSATDNNKKNIHNTHSYQKAKTKIKAMNEHAFHFNTLSRDGVIMNSNTGKISGKQLSREKQNKLMLIYSVSKYVCMYVYMFS